MLVTPARPSPFNCPCQQTLERTEELIRSHIGSHPGLREQRDLLLTIPGIGSATAAKLLGELMEVKLYESARRLAAFVGLVPRLTVSLVRSSVFH